MAAALFFGAGCGGSDETQPSATGSAAASTTTPDASRVALTAAAVLPNLGASGFAQTAPENVAAPGGLDIAFSIYERATEPKLQARAEVRVYPTEADAKADYPTQSQGWKNPPPDVFGIDPKNADATALAGLSEAVAYIGTAVDGERNRVWTDVYRIGRVVVVQHVLGQQERDTDPVRKAMADAIRAKVQ